MCTAECYEQFEEQIQTTLHLNIDDYEAIRRIYTDWLSSWQVTFQQAYPEGNTQTVSDELLDQLDADLSQFDNYLSEGDDGVFAQEIYRYYCLLQQIRKKILQWRPERTKYYLCFHFDELENKSNRMIGHALHNF